MAILLNPSSVLLFITIVISWIPTLTDGSAGPAPASSSDTPLPLHFPQELLAPRFMKVALASLTDYKSTLYECPSSHTDHLHQKTEMNFVVNCESLGILETATLGLLKGKPDVKCFSTHCVKVVHREKVLADGVLCNHHVLPGHLFEMDIRQEKPKRVHADYVHGEWWAVVDSTCKNIGMGMTMGTANAEPDSDTETETETTDSDSDTGSETGSSSSATPRSSGANDHQSEPGHRGRPLSRQGSVSRSASHSRSPSPSGTTTAVNGNESDQEGSVGSRGRSKDKTDSRSPSRSVSPSGRSSSPPRLPSPAPSH